MSGEAKLFRCIKAGKIVKFVPPWNNPIEIIEHWAKIKPGRPALTGLIDSKRWVTRTYCQLLRRLLAVTKTLSELPNERIAIACGSHVTTIEAILSAIAARRQFVPIDLLRKPFSIQLYKLTDSKATVVIIPSLGEMPDLLIDRINDIRRMFPHLKFWSLGENTLADYNLLNPATEGFRLSHIEYPSNAWFESIALLYSPGHHGQPKGYFYQPSALCANIWSVSNWLKLTGKSRLLLATELDCCDGLIPVLAVLSVGGTAILHTQIDSGNFWKIIPECDADIVRAKPSLIEELLNDDSKLAGINRSNLKFVITGSAYLPRQIGLRFFETFDLPLLQSYGTAETGGYILGMSPGLSGREYELALRDNIAGQELGFCNVILKSDTSGDQKIQPNSGEGILHVRGQVLSSGWWDGNDIQYWTDPWLSTSDLAVNSAWQEQQYFQIRGRLEDTLIIDKQRFWPAYIERSMLDTFQFLSDCIVMTLPDREGKSKLCAVVILLSDIPSHRRSELMSLIEARLQAGGVTGLNEKSTPREIIVLNEQQVPRRYDGHPNRLELHRLIAKRITQQGLAAS
ncbi:MAG: class I adenylate-forming enzyme family protein [Phycisphaerae bacterium]